jgi:hypothetical protein
MLYPEKSPVLYKAYLEATKSLHGYLILDFRQDTDNLISFRNNIFLRDYPTIIYAAVFDAETPKIELPQAAGLTNGKANVTKSYNIQLRRQSL